VIIVTIIIVTIMKAAANIVDSEGLRDGLWGVGVG
jgi:hypothetical protein